MKTAFYPNFIKTTLIIFTSLHFSATAQQEGHGKTEWGIWENTLCHMGISFRVRCLGYVKSINSYKYALETKNNYPRLVHYDVRTTYGGKTWTNGRATTNSGEVKSWSTWYTDEYTKSGNVDIENVCFLNDNSWASCSYNCYAECDAKPKIPNQPDCNKKSQQSSNNSYQTTNNSSSQNKYSPETEAFRKQLDDFKNSENQAAQRNTSKQQSNTQTNDLSEYNRSKADMERKLQEENQKIAISNEQIRQRQIQQEAQQRELKRQQEAERKAAYVDLGVQTVKGVFNVINAIKEDKRDTEERLRIKNEEKRATEAIETEAMEQQWIIAKDYAKLNSKENIEKAIQIMLPYASARKLNGSSLNTIGYWYWSLNDFTNSFKWFKEAAEQFDTNALYNLGTAYEKGQGVSKDLNIAIKHYEDACRSDYDKGCINTRRLAKEITKNYSDLDNAEGYYKAIEFTEKLINNKNRNYSKFIDVEILNQLGFWYSKVKDFEKSGFYYKKSCDIGDLNGCEKYGSMKKEIEIKNKKIIALNTEIDLLMPIEINQNVNDSITVDKIIAKYYSAISKEKNINDVKTVTKVWEEDGKLNKIITGIGKNYFEFHDLKENYFYKSMYNGSDGYIISREKKEKMKKDIMSAYKKIKPLSIITASKAHLELGNIAKIGDEMCYSIIEKINKKSYIFTNTNYFNLETGLFLCSKMSWIFDDPKLNSNYYKYFKDYRAVDGILFPFSVLSFDISKKYSKYTFKEIIVNDANAETYFK